MWGLALWREICPSRLMCLPRTPFRCVTYEANWVMLSCGLKSTARCVGRPLGRASHVGQGQPLPVTTQSNLIGAAKRLTSWLLPVLDLEACEGDHARNQGQPPPELGLEKLSKKPKPPANCP